MSDADGDRHSRTGEEAALYRQLDTGRSQAGVAHRGKAGLQGRGAVRHRIEQGQRPRCHQQAGEVGARLHAQVDMQIHQSRQDGHVVVFDDLGIRGDPDRGPGADGCQAITFPDHGRPLDRVASRPVDQPFGHDREDGLSHGWHC
jgi:hypothetical protein